MEFDLPHNFTGASIHRGVCLAVFDGATVDENQSVRSRNVLLCTCCGCRLKECWRGNSSKKDTSVGDGLLCAAIGDCDLSGMDNRASLSTSPDRHSGGPGAKHDRHGPNNCCGVNLPQYCDYR